jgi:hypothetical protein
MPTRYPFVAVLLQKVPKSVSDSQLSQEAAISMAEASGGQATATEIRAQLTEPSGREVSGSA